MSSRSLRMVCIVSVLLNVFLIAAVVSGVAWFQVQAPIGGAGTMRIAGADLPVQDRQAFRHALRAARQQARSLVVTDRRARRDAAALLRAPEVDQQALVKALAKVRGADFAVRAQVEGDVVGFIAALPQAERAKLAESVERRGRARPR